MTNKDLIRNAFAGSDMIVDNYLKGLKKEDLLIRAVPGMNHVAWQMGHLISSERALLNKIKPDAAPALPAGFDEAHSTANHESDDASRFHAPEEYLAIWKPIRAATLKLLDETPDEGLDREDPSFPPIARTVGQLFHLLATHPVLHAGQFVAVRRKLGLPIAF